MYFVVQTTGGTSAAKDLPSLAEFFKKTDGQWVCEMCFVTNTASNLMCLSCETPRPGVASTSSTLPTR